MTSQPTILEGDSLTVHAAQTLCAAITNEGELDQETRYYGADPAFDEIAFKALSGTFSSNVHLAFDRPTVCGLDNRGRGTHSCQTPGITGTLTLTSASAARDNFKFSFGNTQPSYVYAPDATGLDLDTSNLCTVTGTIQVLKPQLQLTKQVCLASGVRDAATRCDASDEQVWTEAADPVANFPEGTKIYWRIAVTNTGNAKLSGVKVASDSAVALDGASGPLADDSTASCLSKPLTPVNTGASSGPGGAVSLAAGTTASADGSFSGGGKAALVCSTDVGAGFTGAVKNTARAEGTFPDKDPNGDPLVDRLPDSKVTSNDDSAVATVYDPRLTLTKEVCSTGTGCADESNPDGAWVKSTMVKKGSPAEWRLTVTNDGNAPIDDIKLVADEVTVGSSKPAAPDGCDIGTLFMSPDEINDMLNPGESFSIFCRTDAVSSVDDALVNTALADGQPRSPDDPGTPLPGYEDRRTETNTDSADVIAADPALTLKKYACAKGTGCTVPSAPFDASTLDTDEWLDTEDGQTPSHVVLPDNSTIQWLIVATNTGNTNLSAVTLSADELSGQTAGMASTCTRGTRFPLPTLDGHQQLVQDASTALDCESSPLQSHVPIADTVNTAQASAVPVLADGTTIVPGYGADDRVESNTDIAKAAAVDLQLTLKKYACQSPATGVTTGAATGCTVPDSPVVTALDLLEAGWWDTDDPGDHVVVESGHPVDWLIVAHNAGNIPFTDLSVIADEVTTGVEHDQSRTESSCLGDLTVLDDSDPLLGPGGYAVRQCTTNAVGATSPASEVINSAVASGMPMDPDEPTNKLNGEATAPAVSNSDVARAQSFTPHLSLTKEVCKTGTGCIADPDAEWVPSVVVAQGTDAEWRLTVTNDGDVPFDDVRVAYDVVTGGKTGNGPTPPGCAPTTQFKEGEKTGLAPGESFSSTCVSTSITDTSLEAVNTAIAAGQPLNPDDTAKKLPGYEDERPQTEPASAEAIATAAAVDVKKYACAQGTGCAVPTGPFTLEDLDTAQWLDTDDGDTPPRVLVADGGTIQWLIVATNTGETNLADVRLADDSLSGQIDGVANTCRPGTAFTLPDVNGTPQLVPEASVAMDCQAGPLTATEPPKDTVNTAQVSGRPVQGDGTTPVPGYTEPVASTTDTAKAAAVDVGLTLTKYACQNPADGTTTGCAVPSVEPVTASDLETAGWRDTDDPGDHVVLEAGQPVDWIIVVRNTGNVPLSAVQVNSDQVTTGVGQDRTTTESSCLGDMTTLGEGAQPLAPGGFAVKQCTTAAVEATSPASEVVNSATASGMPMNPDDSTAKLNGDATTPTVTEPNVARAQAASPALALTKWVCPAGASCSATDFRSESDHGSWAKQTELAPGASGTWLIVVTNTGDVPLESVRLSTESLTAAGTSTRGGDGRECAASFGTQDLPVGASASATCASESIGSKESPLVNTAQATGSNEFGTDVTSRPDAATVTVTPPTPVPPPDGEFPDGASPHPTIPPTAVHLAKQVCKAGTDCDVKTDADWVAVATQPAGRTATWRIVITNTGTEPLKDVTIKDVLSGTRSGPERSCELATATGDLLAPGHQIAHVCTSGPVARSESGLVNTATATATGASSGKTVGTPQASAKVLVQGAGVLAHTGLNSPATAGLALLLVGCGALSLRLCRQLVARRRTR